MQGADARLHDIDSDGHADLLVDDRSPESIRLFRGRGDGTFSGATSIDVGGDPYRGMSLADVTGDGLADLITPNPDHVAVLVAEDDGGFRPRATLPAPFGPFSVVAADLNGDSRQDVAAGSGEGAGSLAIWHGCGRTGRPGKVACAGHGRERMTGMPLGVGKSATPWETLKYRSTGSKFDSMEGNGGGVMEKEFDFERLVELCRRTHEETQRSAARAVDRLLVVRNWLFGWYIVEYEQRGEDRAEYGAQTLKKLSAALKERIGRGFSVRYLRQFRRFYLEFKGVVPEFDKRRTVFSVSAAEEIRQTLFSESPVSTGGASEASVPALLVRRLPLGWSHYVTLLSVSDPEARRFYEIEAADNGWSVRELKRQLGSSLYQRLALSRDKQEVRRLAREGQVVEKASDLIKDPVVLEFLGLEETPAYSESDLETAIIDRLQQFLLELGKGFLFEARQKRFSFDDSHFFVDLVFYNRLLRCYVLIDLKTGKLTHQDLGQMQMYVNYFDRYVKIDGELPTVGIVLCDDKNDAVVELTLPEDANIYASKYQLYLPSKEELADQVARVRREIGGSCTVEVSVKARAVDDG